MIRTAGAGFAWWERGNDAGENTSRRGQKLRWFTRTYRAATGGSGHRQEYVSVILNGTDQAKRSAGLPAAKTREMVEVFALRSAKIPRQDAGSVVSPC